jgi:hypothetical protein
MLTACLSCILGLTFMHLGSITRRPYMNCDRVNCLPRCPDAIGEHRNSSPHNELVSLEFRGSNLRSLQSEPWLMQLKLRARLTRDKQQCRRGSGKIQIQTIQIQREFRSGIRNMVWIMTPLIAQSAWRSSRRPFTRYPQ